MATARIRRNKPAGKAPSTDDALKSLSDRVYDEQAETDRIFCAVHLARHALQTSKGWDANQTLSALHAAMCDIEQRLNAVTNNLDQIFLDLGRVERAAGQRQEAANA